MAPYLSVVMVGRNDSYGGNFTERLQTSLRVLCHLAERHGLDVEVVLVEWNPPSDNPPLKTVIDLPDDLEHASVKIVRVPNTVHRELPKSDSFPLFEFRGKNVGIRRSSGEYILSTNPDIIFGDRLIGYLSEHPLESDCFYRIGRHDVDAAVSDLDALSVDQLLDRCADNVVRTITREGTTIYDLTYFRRFGLSYFLQNPSEIRRPLRLLRDRFVPDSARDATEGPFEREYSTNSVDDIDTNAAGDFLLLPRDGWNEIRGFPELDTNLHVDSYGAFLAASRGYRQIVFQSPLRIYHQEHERDRLDRLDEKPEWGEIAAEGEKLLAGRESDVVNSETWGFGDEEYPIYELMS